MKRPRTHSIDDSIGNGSDDVQQSVLTFVRTLARNPHLNEGDAAIRAELNQIRDAHFSGPAGAIRRRRTALNKERSCSPSSFPRYSAESAEFGAPPPTKLERLLSTVCSTMYANENSSSVRASAAVDTAVQNSGLIGAHRHPTLGLLLLPTRRRSVTELWSAREVAIFESAICVYGKAFHTIQKLASARVNLPPHNYRYRRTKYWTK